jgi:hypothetical protein
VGVAAEGDRSATDLVPPADDRGRHRLAGVDFQGPCRSGPAPGARRSVRPRSPQGRTSPPRSAGPAPGSRSIGSGSKPRSMPTHASGINVWAFAVRTHRVASTCSVNAIKRSARGGQATSESGFDLEDPASLPRRLYGAFAVATSHPCDRLGARNSSEDCHRRQRCPGPADTAPTCDLDPLGRAAFVSDSERGDRVLRRCRRAEVRPPHPPVLPIEGPGIARQEVHAELRVLPVRQRLAQAATANPAAIRELHDAGTISPRCHGGIVGVAWAAPPERCHRDRFPSPPDR